MSEKTPQPGRRHFLKSGLFAAGTVALGSAARPAPAADDKASKTGVKPAVSEHGIPTRPFGKTGVTLPILGFGGSAMVHMWAPFYGVKKENDEYRVAMVRHAFDSGIRYFDSARVYSESESLLGKGLKGVRDQAFITTKVAVPNPEQVRPSVERSLKEYGVDHIDLVQIHSPAIERVGFDGAMKLHAELVKLRDQKMCRYIGLTTHVAFETVHKLISTGGFDQVLLAYGYFRKGMDTLLSNPNLEFREKCLAKAADLKMAVVAMKVMGASILGHNAKNLVPGYDDAARERLPAAAIRWVLQDERVSILNIGVSMPSDVDRNIATLKQDLRLTNEDKKLLADYASRAYESDDVKKMKTV
jgi:aryl-alcohol dehydrogenase-like predicted oxidoreductase